MRQWMKINVNHSGLTNDVKSLLCKCETNNCHVFFSLSLPFYATHCNEIKDVLLCEWFIKNKMGAHASN